MYDVFVLQELPLKRNHLLVKDCTLSEMYSKESALPSPSMTGHTEMEVLTDAVASVAEDATGSGLLMEILSTHQQSSTTGMGTSPIR